VRRYGHRERNPGGQRARELRYLVVVEQSNQETEDTIGSPMLGANMHRLWISIVVAAAVFSPTSEAHASWLSDVTGINIDLARQVAAVQVPPRTVQVPAPVVTVPPTPTVTLATEPERQKLIQTIDDLTKTSAKNATLNGRVALGLVIAAIILGVAAALAGFCKASILAGILSILTTATVGANNALPFRDDASTYRLVSAQSHALWITATLNSSMTQDECVFRRSRATIPMQARPSFRCMPGRC